MKLILLFTLVPLLELALFMTLADTISLPVTLAIILITGVLGAYLSKTCLLYTSPSPRDA